jgi:hypothetical protein
MSDYGLQTGSTTVTSAGPIAFGPDGILFVADNVGARILAVDVADEGAAPSTSSGLALDDVNEAVASLLGTPVDAITIRDLAVQPVSQNVYLSVQRGTGDAGQAVLVRVDRADSSLHDVPLTDVALSETTLADAPTTDDERNDVLLPTSDKEGEVRTFGDHSIRILSTPIRTSTVTDMAFVDGELLVAGLSNEEFSSKLRRIPFPFAAGTTTDNNLEIYHVSHGKWETQSPIRKFVPYESADSILASYTCTPVVVFSLADATPGTKTIGRTVADLGNMNQPLGMVAFRQKGEEHLLVSNSSHGLLKISQSDIDSQEALTEPQEPVGIPRQNEDIDGVTYLANLGDDYVLALQNDDQGHQHLRSLETASL